MSAVFLSGPMSGLPDLNYPAFNAAAAQLRALGHVVENPAENPKCSNWTGYMRLSIAQLMRCDQVVMLPGWRDSRGALIEIELAELLGIPYREAETILGCGRVPA